ncbi:TonB family protein [Halobacteriovorax marinus]|uniref:TonB family protein n=1 Tax=Halobacteriovorax marinus TaxID=97084 RepID=UPI003A95811B
MSRENQKFNSENKQFKNFVLYSILFSAFIHLGFIFSKVDWSSSKKIVVEQKKEKRVKLVFRSNSKKPKQIVNTELKKTTQTPRDAKYLGKQSQMVERQTKAAINGSFKAAGIGVRSGSKQAQTSSKSSSLGKAKKATKSPSKKIVKNKNKKKIKFEDLSLGNLALAQPVTKSAPALGLKNGHKKSRGLAQNNDFMDEIPLADMTRLNTVEYKYYGFYFRIRQKLEQYWGDSLRKQAEKMWKSGRRLASDVNKVTALKITIDQNGNILEVKVKSTSGINELDSAAIESFNRAGPFPNPPAGLIKNGRAQIEWGFVVKS